MKHASTVIGLALVVLLLAGIAACRRPPVPAGPVTSRGDAVTLVTALSDVTAWIKLVHTDSPANRTVIEVDSEDATMYTVHAYEVVDDGDGNSHTATFGWYEVAKATGVVRSAMP